MSAPQRIFTTYKVRCGVAKTKKKLHLSIYVSQFQKCIIFPKQINQQQILDITSEFAWDIRIYCRKKRKNEKIYYVSSHFLSFASQFWKIAEDKWEIWLLHLNMQHKCGKQTVASLLPASVSCKNHRSYLICIERLPFYFLLIFY